VVVVVVVTVSLPASSLVVAVCTVGWPTCFAAEVDVEELDADFVKGYTVDEGKFLVLSTWTVFVLAGCVTLGAVVIF